MERRFDMSDFEQSLKDQADQFTLIPSRRVWNGIYNNLHPGSKWPSITVAIVFVITLFTIGFFNNSSKKHSSEAVTSPTAKSIANNYGTPANLKASGTNSTIGNKTTVEKNTSIEKDDGVSLIDNKGNLKKSENERLNTAVGTKKNKNVGQNGTQAFFSNRKNISSKTEGSISRNKIADDNNINYKPTNQRINEEENNEISLEDYHSFMAPGQALINEYISIEPAYNNNNEAYTLVTNTEDFSSSYQLVTSSLLETHIHPLKKTTNQSKKNHRKRNKNVEWTYYVTPMISAPIFRNSSLSSSVNFSPLAIFQNAASNGMIYHANLAFETGAKITYAVSKKWKVFSGVNLNYSDYNLVSNLLHPTFATLTLKDKNTGIPYSKSYITFYGNGQSLNQVPLTNYSFQFSIPIGLEYQVWGNKNIQISIASAIEPSVVLKSNSYIISADKKYYVQDPGLMRKMNLGGNFGTFISFGSNKIIWHIGPDIHYQLLSTYKNSYLSEEHLIDYGIRIGISKKY